MDRFKRREAPGCLPVAKRDLCVERFNANSAWKTFRSRDCYGEVRSALLSSSRQTCAFCAGGFAQSNETIEHFRPKAGDHAEPEAVLEWSNLFPACNQCQSAKGAKFSTHLLKPDQDDYIPANCFVANAADGSLEGVPGAMEVKANVTIETYKLNRPALKLERRRAIRAIGESPGQPVEEYRFLAELFSTE